MRIAELQRKLAEIKEEYGNCPVIIDDERLGAKSLTCEFSVEDAMVEDKSGDGHEVVSLRIPAEKSEERPLPEGVPGYFRDLKTFHEQIIELMNTNVQMFEAHLCQVEKALNNKSQS